MLALVSEVLGEERWVHTAASLDGVKALPNHSDNGAAVHVYGESQHDEGREIGRAYGATYR